MAKASIIAGDEAENNFKDKYPFMIKVEL